MEDMLAAKLNDCLFSETLDIADDAVGISVFSESIRFIFGNTIFVKARWMFGLMTIPIARMTALKELSTASVCLLLALTLRAHILTRVFHGCLTESALLHVFLFLKLCASLPHMIGLDFAADAEVVPTLIAAHTVGAHVSRSRLVDILALLILVVVVNLALHEFNRVATLASEDAVVLIKKLQGKLGLKVLIELRPQDAPHFLVQNLTLAAWVQTLDFRVGVLYIF
jgi:hypothetical protein